MSVLDLGQSLMLSGNDSILGVIYSNKKIQIVKIIKITILQKK